MKKLLPYYIISFVMVISIVTLLSKIMPTGKDLTPAAETLLRMSGDLK